MEVKQRLQFGLVGRKEVVRSVPGRDKDRMLPISAIYRNFLPLIGLFK